MTSYSEITPADFSKNLTDRNRHQWTPEKFWWIMEAQKVNLDSRLIVTTDSMTGHAEGPYRVEGVRQTLGYGTHQVLLAGELADGSRQGCWFPIGKIGAVMEVSESFTKSLKWTALDIQRERRDENPYYEMSEYARKQDRDRATSQKFDLHNRPGWDYYNR